MKQLVLIACILGWAFATGAAASSRVRQATFTAPYAHPADPTYPIHCGPVPYRWGWFGAEHYPPAPVRHRDYNRGWREWHYRW